MKIVKIATAWFVHLGVWMLLVSTLSIRDFCIGLLTVSFATFMAIAAKRLMKIKFKPTFHEVIQAWRMPWDVVVGTSQVMKALALQLLARKPAGSFILAVPFDIGGDDARSVARRTLAITGATISPNSVILGPVPRETTGHDPFGRDVMLYHQITPGPVRPIFKILGAKP